MALSYLIVHNFFCSSLYYPTVDIFGRGLVQFCTDITMRRLFSSLSPRISQSVALARIAPMIIGLFENIVNGVRIVKGGRNVVWETTTCKSKWCETFCDFIWPVCPLFNGRRMENHIARKAKGYFFEIMIYEEHYQKRVVRHETQFSKIRTNIRTTQNCCLITGSYSTKL